MSHAEVGGVIVNDGGPKTTLISSPANPNTLESFGVSVILNEVVKIKLISEATQGPVGPQGLIGPQGLVGPKGVTGNDGTAIMLWASNSW